MKLGLLGICVILAVAIALAVLHVIHIVIYSALAGAGIAVLIYLKLR